MRNKNIINLSPGGFGFQTMDGEDSPTAIIRPSLNTFQIKPVEQVKIRK